MDSVNIFFEGEAYGSWGNVYSNQGYNAYGLASCRNLRTALLSMDEDLLDWQCSFPGDVVDEVVRYPQGQVELLDMAALMPDRFVALSRQCPAVVAMASSFWLYCEDYDGQRPDAETVSKFWGWFYVTPKKRVLDRLGFVGTKSEFLILSRMHVLECDHASLFEVRALLADSKKRTALSYVSELSRCVRVLADWGYLDFHLLELAANEPKKNGETLYSIIADIREWLDRALVEGWPYKGAIRSWEQALRIRSRLNIRYGEDPFVWRLGGAKFPAPPLCPKCSPEGMVIESIDCLEALDRETEEMCNCSVTFASKVFDEGCVYFYKLLKPVRATVQLVKSDDGNWSLNQIVGYDNVEVDEAVKALLETWVVKEQGGYRAAE